MTAALIASIVLGVLGIAAGGITAAHNANQQKLHDRQMAELELDNQKKLLDYETELQQTNNTIATQKGHAAAAGYSPALLYGQMSAPALQDVNGGSTGASASHLPEMNLFDRLPLSNISENILTEQQQSINRERLQSEVMLNKQKALESAARTAEQTRYTGLQKNLEKTIIDQAVANLHATDARTGYFESMTNQIDVMLPYEVQRAGLINEQTAKQTAKIVQDTLQSKAQTSLLYVEKRRISALAELAEEQEGTPTAEREAIRANIAGMQESIRRSAVGRIMSESGLSGVKLPPSMRGDLSDLDSNNFSKSKFYVRHSQQINGALSALVALGFSPDEAAMAVCYYVADARDISPSLINGMTRVASGIIAKK